jgi:surfeit locus 1 family protein
MALLLTLGNWQLNRAEEKRQLLALQAQQASSETIHLSLASEDNAENLRYKNTQLTGHFDVNHQFLLDNQISAGKAGYFVLTPFWLGSTQKAVLINRGWLPSNPTRAILPDLTIIDKEQMTLTGRINHFPSVGIKLAGAEIPTNSWPSVVQVVDHSILSKKLGYPLFNFQIELDKNMPEGYKRDWQISTTISPEKHKAYAFQWLSLALTVTILFIWSCIKKQHD